MTSAWAFVGRDDEWAIAVSALRASTGILLVGPAGVGKSRFADELHQWATSEGWFPLRMRATRGTSEIPLGVFAPVLGSTPRTLDPLLVETRDAVLSRAEGRPVLLCIDDVDLLDDTSSALVHQLVSTSPTTVVLTHRSGLIIPAEIADLWRRGSLSRLELGPLDAAGTAALAGAILGERLAGPSVTRLHETSGGNPLYCRELLAAAQEAGGLRAAPATPDGGGQHGMYVLHELPAASTRLVDLVRGRLASLDPGSIELLEHLAFAEPVGPGEVDGIGGPGALEELERHQLIVVEADGRRLVIRLAHPLYGRILRDGAGAVRRRAILGRLAAALEATGARRRLDTLKLARLAVDGGRDLDPSVLAAAASMAYHAEDHELARRLGQAGFERTGDFMPGWDLALAQFALGDLHGFDDHVPRWTASARTAGHAGAVALAEANVTHWLRDDPAGADDVLARAIEDIDGTHFDGPGVSADELRAVLGHHAALARRAHEALEIVEPLLDRGPDQVLIRASLAAALAQRTLGRPADAIETLDRALAAYAALGPQAISLSSRIVEGTRLGALVEIGDLEGAEQGHLAAMAEGADSGGLSIPGLVGAYCSLLRGDGRAAAERSESALQRLGEVNTGVNVRWFRAMCALALARRGDTTGSSQTIERIDRSPAGPSYLEYVTWLARAARATSDARPVDAVDTLRGGLAEATAHGDVVGAITLAHQLAMLGDVDEAAEHLRPLVTGTQGVLFPAMWAHVDGLTRRDPDRLSEATHAFEAMGALPFAAAAAGDAADAAQRAGDQRAAARWRHQAAELRARCTTVAVALPDTVDAGPVPLTRREREVAMLAAQGLSSREIGERLYISRRTAETHLGRVYDKLGIRSRADLVRVFDGGTAALAS